MIIELKDEFKRISAAVGATFSCRSHPEMEKFTQTHDFTTPIINLLPVEDINQNIMDSGAVRYDFRFKLYFLTNFNKSDTLEANKDVLLDTMIALSEAFYRELNKNEALLFIRPNWTWKNNLARQYLSNLTLGCVTDVFIDTSCARSPSPIPAPLPPETFDELVALIGRGYNYTQPTGQITIFTTNDDADVEATVFAPPIREANSLKAQNSLANFFTLNNNNSYGNLNRFTDTAGGQNYDGTGGDIADVVVDNYTGLAIFRLPQSTTDWLTAIANSRVFSIGGLANWFIPNKFIMNSIKNHTSTSGATGLNYPPFNVSIGNLWISTTNGANTNQAYVTTVGISNLPTAKGNPASYLLFTKFF